MKVAHLVVTCLSAAASMMGMVGGWCILHRTVLARSAKMVVLMARSSRATLSLLSDVIFRFGLVIATGNDVRKIRSAQ
ncbi:Os09g0111300 [Oryza sativa Japonica Group]|uniref:Os09g0111300 protein n=1 Tax=Oryza sativa subsp. japonica TaxID=39947 RepID=A0A0P0XIG2_ORYSJ|nr:Os09g0111300 [Oryza sativa Japonica Group]